MTTGSARLRHLLRGLCLAAALAMLAGCGAVPSSTEPSHGPIAPPQASPSASVMASAEVAPLPIDVVEAGLTAFPGDAGGFVSYAAVLRNPNAGWMLQRAEVLVDFLDPAGGFVGGEELLVTILPGQTTAISGQSAGAAAATQIVVRPPEDQTAFVQRAAAGEGFDVLDVTTEAMASQWLTTGALVSRFQEPQTFVQLFAVHRASGRIIGGGGGGVESIVPGGTAPFEVVDSSPYAELGATDVYWQVTR